MQLPELATWWHESLAATASAKTIVIYRAATDGLIDWMQDTGLPLDEPPDRRVIERYFTWFRQRPNLRTGKPLAGSTVNQHYRSMQQFYKWLEAEELITRNPFTTGMVAPTVDETPVPVFTDDELTALVAVTAGKSARQRRDRAILRTLLDTGMRIGELVGIDLDHIDYGQKIILVTGKARRSRHVPFNSKCYSELRRWQMVRPNTSSTKLFVGLRGRNEALTDSGVRQILDKIADTCGVEGMHPHRFRHTFAHNWLACGGLESDLQRIMGWTTTQMVQRYGASAASSRAQSAAWKLALGDRY